MLLAAIVAVAIADAVGLCVPSQPAHATAFQAAICSLGLGPALSGAWSFHGFDPRLESACDNELTPIPGLSCPNPYHGAAVVDFPPLTPARE